MILLTWQGVSGSGKSTLGQALGESLGMPFIDGDDLHPKANVEKMSAGHPLTDADREPWLELIRTTAEHRAAEQQIDPSDTTRAGLIVGCSALKKYYRDILRGTYKPHAVPEHLDPPHPNALPTYFVFIKGSKELLVERMTNRQGHFMKETMLNSQLDTLETPESEDGVVIVPLEVDTNKQVEIVREELSSLIGPL
jgi:gluconokinase